MGLVLDKVRDILLLFAAAMGVFALICAVYQAMNDKVTASIALAGMFLVCVMVVFLPRLEILEAFGVKAHLVKTLNEAELILEKLRKTAILNAKAAYMNVGTGSRWGVTQVKDKQEMLDEIDNQLRDLNVSIEDRRALSATYVRIIGFDLYMFYVQTLERFFSFKEQRLVAEVGRNPEGPAKDELAKWRTRDWKPNHGLFENLDSYSFEDEIRRVTSGEWLNQSDKAGFELFKNQLLSLYRGVQAKGGYTTEAADYYEKYHDLGGQDKKIVEIFGFNPSAQ